MTSAAGAFFRSSKASGPDPPKALDNLLLQDHLTSNLTTSANINYTNNTSIYSNIKDDVKLTTSNTEGASGRDDTSSLTELRRLSDMLRNNDEPVSWRARLVEPTLMVAERVLAPIHERTTRTQDQLDRAVEKVTSRYYGGMNNNKKNSDHANSIANIENSGISIGGLRSAGIEVEEWIQGYKRWEEGRLLLPNSNSNSDSPGQKLSSRQLEIHSTNIELNEENLLVSSEATAQTKTIISLPTIEDVSRACAETHSATKQTCDVVREVTGRLEEVFLDSDKNTSPLSKDLAAFQSCLAKSEIQRRFRYIQTVWKQWQAAKELESKLVLRTCNCLNTKAATRATLEAAEAALEQAQIDFVLETVLFGFRTDPSSLQNRLLMMEEVFSAAIAEVVADESSSKFNFNRLLELCKEIANTGIRKLYGWDNNNSLNEEETRKKTSSLEQKLERVPKPRKIKKSLSNNNEFLLVFRQEREFLSYFLNCMDVARRHWLGLCLGLQARNSSEESPESLRPKKKKKRVFSVSIGDGDNESPKKTNNNNKKSSLKKPKNLVDPEGTCRDSDDSDWLVSEHEHINDTDTTTTTTTAASESEEEVNKAKKSRFRFRDVAFDESTGKWDTTPSEEPQTRLDALYMFLQRLKISQGRFSLLESWRCVVDYKIFLEESHGVFSQLYREDTDRLARWLSWYHSEVLEEEEKAKWERAKALFWEMKKARMSMSKIENINQENDVTNEVNINIISQQHSDSVSDSVKSDSESGSQKNIEAVSTESDSSEYSNGEANINRSPTLSLDNIVEDSSSETGTRNAKKKSPLASASDEMKEMYEMIERLERHGMANLEPRCLSLITLRAIKAKKKSKSDTLKSSFDRTTTDDPYFTSDLERYLVDLLEKKLRFSPGNLLPSRRRWALACVSRPDVLVPPRKMLFCTQPSPEYYGKAEEESLQGLSLARKLDLAIDSLSNRKKEGSESHSDTSDSSDPDASSRASSADSPGGILSSILAGVFLLNF